MRGRIVAVVAAVAALVVALVVLVARPGGGEPATAAAAPPASGCAVRSTAVPGAATSKLPVEPLCALPKEAAQTWRLIVVGGPFPYDRDGIVFQNREKLLPSQKSGYYHEYTVPTPGSDDRGARRLVTGGPRGAGQELYYSADHYTSFVVVDPTATS